MPRKILYFINPVSGPKRNISPAEVIIAATTSKQIAYEIAETNAEGNYPNLAEKVFQEQFTDVVIYGGDGTVSQVAAALLDVNVNIGIIPSGSGNGLALAANIPKDIHKALTVIFNGEPDHIDAFLINDKFSCMLSGLGLDAQVAHDFAKASTRGLPTYIKKTIANFFKAQPYTFDILIDGQTLNTPAFFISIANGNQFGNNVKIAPKASLKDGLIDLVIVSKMSKGMLLWSVAKHLLTGKPASKENKYQHKKIIYLQLPAFEIHNHAMAPLHIDGEPANTAQHFKIKVIPGAFKLIMPSVKP